jgi:hypothetical protein
MLSVIIPSCTAPLKANLIVANKAKGLLLERDPLMGATTLSIMTLCMKSLFAILSINSNEHNTAITPSVLMLSVVGL